MQAATIQKTEPNPTLHRCHMVVDGNVHRNDLFGQSIPQTEHPTVSEALLPNIRTTATLIAAMRHQFDRPSPTVFTEEADWFAARILVLGVRFFHLDITLLPMLSLANRRAKEFAALHQLPFTPAKMRMSLHAGRPSNLLIIETEHRFDSTANLIADSLAFAKMIARKQS
ncbi:hypothetical protein [Neisseria weaveri]|uniref:Uncharacterized protein n=1 Tax=Neisseria weaveri TaxID=28091 RepID=A0A3S4ZET6_9NEIS|nr:hypothetical protein [Neisseria weaveri]EGV37996.1 hypothetical protein l11_07330 [Neisseria weaveri LMG 5135]VEJ52169.1 Uncharacterised protein [Neisseria weaveri]